ncbi:MAG TPA: alpha/beta hydrolase-fold protein [Thermoanaerobaculia bacterium]|nr:alpha/beta hydrolase-fold protein [Thermoanaerobaculia bacterium]
MDSQFLDPSISRVVEGWNSPSLGQPMPIVSYGHWGHPLLLFPTASADFLENERFFLIKAIEPALRAGRVRVFSIDSINRQAWMDQGLPVAEKARRQALYSRYVEEEVAPYIRGVCRTSDVRIGVSGASFGAFHAANTLFRRPEIFDALIAMSGFYDLAPSYLHGYSDDNCYFNNPAWYVPNLEGQRLDLLRSACKILILTGQGAWEAPEASRRFSALLHRKGIPHRLDVWGHDVEHDWPWWRKMLPHAIDVMGW